MCDMFFLRSRGQYFHFVVLWSSTPYNLELTVLTKCLKIFNGIHETTKTRHQYRTLRVFTRDFDYFLASSESSRVTLARLEASSKFRTHTRHACWGWALHCFSRSQGFPTALVQNLQAGPAIFFPVTVKPLRLVLMVDTVLYWNIRLWGTVMSKSTSEAEMLYVEVHRRMIESGEWDRWVFVRHLS